MIKVSAVILACTFCLAFSTGCLRTEVIQESAAPVSSQSTDVITSSVLSSFSMESIATTSSEINSLDKTTANSSTKSVTKSASAFSSAPTISPTPTIPLAPTITDSVSHISDTDLEDIMFIGNSLTSVGDIPSKVVLLAKSSGKTLNVIKK